MTFKNTERGLAACKWWRNACIDWCFARPENGKFGDQKYLDDWPTRFEGVIVLKEPGAGVAPWNLQKLPLRGNLSAPQITVGGSLQPLFFFHFHGIRFFSDGNSLLGTYKLTPSYKRKLLIPYTKEVGRHIRNLSKKGGVIGSEPRHISAGTSNQPTRGLKSILKIIYRWVRNIFRIHRERLYRWD